MSQSTLLSFILVISAIIIGVSFTGFFFFSRFLKKEQARGERFRELNQIPPDERTGQP